MNCHPSLRKGSRNTDEMYRGVHEAAAANLVKDPRLDNLLNALDGRMRQIADLRQKVDAKTPMAPGASTAIIAPGAALGIEFVGAAASLANEAVVSRRILALYATLQFSESALVQRGGGQLVLQAGKVAPEAFLLLAKNIPMNATFRKMFDDYGLADVVKSYQAFDTANGRELQELRELILKNPGTPGSEAQLRRWNEISRDITGVMTKAVATTAEMISAEADQMVTDAWRSSVIYLGVSVGMVVLVLLLTWMVVRGLRGLLAGLTGTMEALRNGQLEIQVPSVERKDEIGVLARAAETFRTNLIRMQALETEQKEAQAHAAAQRKHEMHKLADDFEQAVGHIVETVSSSATELEGAADTLTQTARTTEQLSSVVAGASDEASSNVQTVAAATDELSSSVEEISRRVQESNQIAADAVRQAERTDGRIAELSQAASRIGDVVKLITAIAEQTNLLALNATIEAARAGEAGRGFAVVASEVKSLAMQTAKATEEIGSQIAGMQAATNDSVAAIKEISGTIGRISEITSVIAAAVEEQGATTREISRNVQEAAKGTSHVAKNITDVSTGARQTGSASGQVLASAKALSSEGNHLRREVDAFVASIRAA